jgi:hypothetical protein
LVRQRGLVSEFTLSQVMTLRVRSAGPVVGTIDLRGPPWLAGKREERTSPFRITTTTVEGSTLSSPSVPLEAPDE